MKNFVFAVLVAAAGAAFGAVCSDTYYVNQMVLTTLRGPHLDSLATASVETLTVNGASPMTAYNRITRLGAIKYSILHSFQSTCDAYASHSVSYAERDTSASVFTPVARNMLTMFASTVNIGQTELDLVFLIKPSGAGAALENLALYQTATLDAKTIYTGGILVDTIRDGFGSRKSAYSIRFTWGNPVDFEGWLAGVKSIVAAQAPADVPGDVHQKTFTLQQLGVTYRSTPPPVAAREAPALTEGPQLSRTAQGISLTLPAGERPSSIKVRDLRGVAVAKVRGNSGTYLWDGRGFAGSRLPAGIYLLEAGSRAFKAVLAR